MTAKKTPSTTASKSTQLTDAPLTTVSTLNPDNAMKSDNPTNSINAVNSDNVVNSTTPADTVNLFGNEQSATEATAVTDTTQLGEQPKQQRIGKQQRKSDYAEFKATYLAPSKLVKLTLSTSRTAYGRSSNASPVSSVTATQPSAAISTPSLSSI